MVVRVDGAGHHQPVGGVDDFVAAVNREIAADRDDVAVLDQNIGDRGLMDVAIVIVDLSAADQQSVIG